jgi:uncharacterized protein
MKINFTAVIVFSLASTLSHAASFDCKKASNFIENTICNDSRLNKLDDVLSENYKNISTSNIGVGARKDLKATQRSWLAVRNKCTDSECLVKSYEQRIDEVCDYPVITGVHPGCTSYEEEVSVKTLNEKQALDSNTTQKTTLTQAKVENSKDTGLEKAWGCNPKTMAYGERYVLFLDNTSCNPERSVYPVGTMPGHVNMPAESQRLAELILNTYHIDLSNPDTFKSFNEELQRRTQLSAQVEQERVAATKIADDERANKLRSGKVKIATMKDALVLYPENDSLFKTAVSPMLTPNMTTMTGHVLIDALEKPGFIRAKATTAMAIYLGQGGSEYAYVYLQLTKKSKNFAPDKLRIGGNSIVIGKYVKNVQYNTIDGQEKTAPVIEVMYIN